MSAWGTVSHRGSGSGYAEHARREVPPEIGDPLQAQYPG